MMLAKVFSCTILGINGIPLEIEVDISEGLPAFDIIGLPDAAVREAKERVRAAIRNSGYDFPYARVTVNLAPADLKKEGSAFDLAMAVGFLAATGQIPGGEGIHNAVFVGELALDGSLRNINGTLAMALSLVELEAFQDKTLFIPAGNSNEASLVERLTVKGAASLHAVVNHLCGIEKLTSAKSLPGNARGSLPVNSTKRENGAYDFREVRGQETAKRALEIAAAGAHNLLIYGPPGSGKTMLARRIPSILPTPTLDEILEMTRIHSVAGQIKAGNALLLQRPFRSPHHSATAAGIIGGGKIPRPGEVSLAHCGVLFFDELPEYRREILEALRQPLEDRVVTVTRAAATITYPADFMFIGSMNPCPCGNYGDPYRECRCSPQQVQNYRGRLSGPLLDRIDIQVEAPGVRYEELQKEEPGESSSEIRARVETARALQIERYEEIGIGANAQLPAKHFDHFCFLQSDARSLLHEAFRTLHLSMRSHERIIKVARTIADLENSAEIKVEHIAEAVQYRNLDRQV